MERNGNMKIEIDVFKAVYGKNGSSGISYEKQDNGLIIETKSETEFILLNGIIVKKSDLQKSLSIL